MTKHVRINIKSLLNTSKVRTEKRNGREIMVVPSATLPDNVVMNGVMYPAEEIEKSYLTLNRTPAPFGHPMINNMFVSASDPEGINIGYIGAWNENVRRENGRVLMDKIIDVEVANRSENGKRVIEAINEEKPIHTSTGLYTNLVESNVDGHKWVANDMQFDHDAILLDEEGAATPDQGVGMLVNGKKIDVINSSLDEIDERLDWAVDSIVRTLEQRQRVPMLQRIKAALLEAFSDEQVNSREKENAEMADEKKLADFETRLNSMEKSFQDALSGITESVTNALTEALAPVNEQITAISNAQKATEEAEKTAMVNKVVEAGVLSEEAAKTLTNSALSELVAKIKPKTAKGLNPAFNSDDSDKDEFADYDLNAMLEEGKK